MGQEIAKPVQTELPSQANSLSDFIQRAATDSSIDINKLERLIAMHERAEAKAAELAFNQAMTAAQSEMQHVRTDSANSQTRSRYASYGALDRAIRPIFTKHGFSLSFDTGPDAPESTVRVLCYVAHDGGHSRTYRADIPADGKGAKGNDVMTKTHATGSALSYGQRYLLKMIFNIAVSDDDDGNGASIKRGADTVDESQLQHLRDRIAATGTDIEKFCAYMKIDALPDLPAQDFGRAMEALNAKERKPK